MNEPKPDHADGEIEIIPASLLGIVKRRPPSTFLDCVATDGCKASVATQQVPR